MILVCSDRVTVDHDPSFVHRLLLRSFGRPFNLASTNMRRRSSSPFFSSVASAIFCYFRGFPLSPFLVCPLYLIPSIPFSIPSSSRFSTILLTSKVLFFAPFSPFSILYPPYIQGVYDRKWVFSGQILLILRVSIYDASLYGM